MLSIFAAVVVRCLMVGLFLPFSALDKILNFGQAVGQAEEATSRRWLAMLLIAGGFSIEVIMSAAILAGIADHLAALILAAYCFVTALLWRQGLAHCCYSTLFGQWEENLPGYLDIFGFGMLSAYLWTRYVSKAEGARSRAIGTAVAIAGFALLAWLLGSMYDYRHADQWSSVWQIDYRGCIGLAFAIVALGSLAGAVWWKALLPNPVLTFLAEISYNLYLYHQIILREMVWHHVPPSGAKEQHYDPTWQMQFTYLAFAITIACSAFVTYAFERPIIRKAGH